MANEMRLTYSLNKDNVPVINQQQLAYVLLEIMPTEIVASVQMPLNFSLVLDKSGSMSGKKIKRVKAAVDRVIDLLGQDDYISVVAFSGSTETLVKSQQARSSSDKRSIKRKIDRLDASGWTTMAPAMKAARSEIMKQSSPNRINRMVLLTDGQTDGEDDCKKSAQRIASDGIQITALGIGTDWNEDFLIDIGQLGGGETDYIAHANEIEQFFQTAIQSMQSAVIQNAELTLRLVAGVHPRKVWRVVPIISDLGYSPISDRAITVPLGELEKGQGQALLVELMLPSRQPGSYRIAQAEVSYDIPALNLAQEKVRADVMLGYTQDAWQAQQVNPAVMNIVEKVTAFKLQTRALQEADMGNKAGATQKLRAAATILLNQGDADLAKTMNLEADKLEQQGQMSNEGRKTIKFTGSKTIRLG